MTIEGFIKKYRNELSPLSYLDEKIDCRDRDINNSRIYSPVYVFIPNIAGIRLSDEESIHLFDLCGEDLSYTSEADNYVKTLFDSHVEELYEQFLKNN